MGSMMDVRYGGTSMALVSAPFAEHDRTGRVGDRLPSMPTACDTGKSRQHVPEPYDDGEDEFGLERTPIGSDYLWYGVWKMDERVIASSRNGSMRRADSNRCTRQTAG